MARKWTDGPASKELTSTVKTTWSRCSGSVLARFWLGSSNLVEPTCTGNTDAGGCDDRVDLAQQSLLNKLIRHSLVLNRNQVEVQQRDPNSPLYSVKSFEELRL